MRNSGKECDVNSDFSTVVILWSSAVLVVMCNSVVPLGCAIDVGSFFFFNLITEKCSKRFSLTPYTCLPTISR